jgi:hypothetical protein
VGSELRSLFEHGFVMPALDPRLEIDTYPWLSLREQLHARPDCTRRHDHYGEFPGMRWQSLDILGCSCSGPARQRPISHVSYDLSGAMRLHEATAFDALRGRLGDALGLEGEYAEFEHHGGTPSSSVRARTNFRLEGLELTLSSIRAPRDSRGYVLTAILSLHPSLVSLAAPYLADFDALDQAWSAGDPSARVVAELQLPKLEAYRSLRMPPIDLRHELALYHPERRAPPQWLRPHLAPHKLVHWTCAEYWGLATPDFTTLFAQDERPALHLTRLTPARGSGDASLGLRTIRGSLWRTRPGPEGLDSVTEYLRGLGCEVLESEFPDA